MSTQNEIVFRTDLGDAIDALARSAVTRQACAPAWHAGGAPATFADFFVGAGRDEAQSASSSREPSGPRAAAPTHRTPWKPGTARTKCGRYQRGRKVDAGFGRSPNETG